MSCCSPTAQHPRARPTLHARSLPSHHLRTLSTCSSLGPASPTRGTTSGTSACAHAGHRGPGGAGPAASARRSSTYATPPAGMPGCDGLPGWGAGPTNPPETRQCLVRGARGRLATSQGGPGKTRARAAPQLRGWVGARVWSHLPFGKKC